MVRDYSFQVPDEYREDNQGYIDVPGLDAGLQVPPRRGGWF